MPARLQRMRIKGWSTPAGGIIVDRTSFWGNPYRVGDPGVPDNATAVRLYERDLLAGTLTGYKCPDILITPAFIKSRLRGYHLVCPCKPGVPCHADALLRIAYSPD